MRALKASLQVVDKAVSLKFVKSEIISLSQHPQFDERWVQELIASDPSILGLGELELRDKERIQPKAGRLDLLLQEPDSNRRYEVEIQLGKTDESHIIRTIEYWDIERKRYPQYEHCAVIIAENITSRFLNVLSLFNGNIPLIAIQMNAFKVNDAVTISFTKILDEVTRGLVDEDESKEIVNRAYWEDRGSKETVAMADEMLGWINSVGPQMFELNYNKHYIGILRSRQPYNFIVFKPRKNAIVTEFCLDSKMKSELEERDLDIITYDTRQEWVHLRLKKDDMDKNKEFLQSLFLKSLESWQN